MKQKFIQTNIILANAVLEAAAGIRCGSWHNASRLLSTFSISRLEIEQAALKRQPISKETLDDFFAYHGKQAQKQFEKRHG